MKNKEKKKRKRSLNKGLLLLIMLGYIGLLVLMVALDLQLIVSYRRTRENKELDIVEKYTEQVKSHMEKIDLELYGVYSNNKNFLELGTTQPELQEYESGYELKETLQKRMIIEQSMSGFYIFYDNYKKTWYGANPDQIPSDQTAKICELLRQRLLGGENMRNWFSVVWKGNTYLAIYYQKNHAAVCGVYSLRNAEKELQNAMGRDVSVIFTDHGLATKHQELAKKLEIADPESYIKVVQKRKENSQLTGARIGGTEFWIYVVYSLKLRDLANLAQLILILVTLLSVIAVVILYIFIRKQIIRPLHQLKDTMDEIREGRCEIISEEESCFYEFWEIRDTLERMLKELEQQKMLVYEEIIEKQKAQMQYLQLQLKPHFYLNGLKTLNALVLEKKTEKMQNLILNLSTHLRYLLQSERELVFLKEEVEFIENYVEMQKNITGRLMTCEIIVDPKLQEWKIPVLSIQTFVENSVKYAKTGSNQIPLEIKVRAEQLTVEDKEYLDLTISDNGQGYPEEMLDELNGDVSETTQHVGINNLKRRCRFLYHDQAEYVFDTMDGAYSELILPRK